MTIYAEFPLWLGLYSGDPLAGGTALSAPRARAGTWEALTPDTFVATDTLRFHIRTPAPAVTHGALFDAADAQFPLSRLVYALPTAFQPVTGRDLAVRPGGLAVAYARAGSSRPFGRWAFGIGPYGRWPAAGFAIEIVSLVLDTLFEAEALACGGAWDAGGPVCGGAWQASAPICGGAWPVIVGGEAHAP